MSPQALALLDAAAGDGGPFWEAYANEVLPAPEALTVPFCLPDALLQELRCPAIASGAHAQQVPATHAAAPFLLHKHLSLCQG